MSVSREETITCQGCGWQQPFTVWQSLNVNLNPECKQELIDGRLTRFVCEKCGWASEVVPPLLYHDMDKPVMIWLVPSEDKPDKSQVPDGESMKEYRLRFVRTRNELVEKILIFEAGLDDRVVELLKLAIRVGHEDDGRPVVGDLFFGRIGSAETGEKTIEFVCVNERGISSKALPMQLLDDLRNSFAGKLPPPIQSMGAG